MEVSFRELRQKNVVDVISGANLGHVCDLVFRFDSGCVVGFVVPEKGLFCKDEIFIPLSAVQKIGKDVVLVRSAPQGKRGRPPKADDCDRLPPRREEEDCDE